MQVLTCLWRVSLAGCVAFTIVHLDTGWRQLSTAIAVAAVDESHDWHLKKNADWLAVSSRLESPRTMVNKRIGRREATLEGHGIEGYGSGGRGDILCEGERRQCRRGEECS